jgi:DNA excision repair protein ERCC-2
MALPTLVDNLAGRFCAERLQSLIRTLELSRLDEHSSLQKVASFATLVATYEKGINSQSFSSTLTYQHLPGFLLILEPFETDSATVPNPVFHFTFGFLSTVTLAGPD